METDGKKKLERLRIPEIEEAEQKKLKILSEELLQVLSEETLKKMEDILVKNNASLSIQLGSGERWNFCINLGCDSNCTDHGSCGNTDGYTYKRKNEKR